MFRFPHMTRMYLAASYSVSVTVYSKNLGAACRKHVAITSRAEHPSALLVALSFFQTGKYRLQLLSEGTPDLHSLFTLETQHVDLRMVMYELLDSFD